MISVEIVSRIIPNEEFGLRENSPQILKNDFHRFPDGVDRDD